MNTSIPDLWTIPAGPPPAGQVSNFVNPPDEGRLLAIGIYVLLPLMSSFVVARIFTRAYMTRTFGVDDLLCILGVVSIFTFSGLLLAILNLKPYSPLGKHIWDIPVAAYSNKYAELLLLASVASPASLMFVKLSILAFNHRLLQAASGARYAIWVGIALVTIFYMANIIFYLAACVPRHGTTWVENTSPGGTCLKFEVAVGDVQGIFGLVSDLYIVAIPIWMVSHLSLSRKRKAGVIVVFMTGFLAIGSSLGGVIIRYRATTSDPNYIAPLFLFMVCEISFGIICGCMPAITALLRIVGRKTSDYWASIRKFSTGLLPHTQQSSTNNEKQQLPDIPHGTLSGMRTFIRRLYRTNGQSVLLSDASTRQLDTVQEYHEQLRNIHTHDVERLPPVGPNKYSFF